MKRGETTTNSFSKAGNMGKDEGKGTKRKSIEPAIDSTDDAQFFPFLLSLFAP
jgi:hypothetical protein